MGCNSSKSLTDVQPSEPAPQKKIVDRVMLVVTQKKNETIKRNPDDICGNQFCVDELEKCNVIVTDVCDSMTIDRCIDCELILSAVKGSIFIRDCKNCKFQMVCGQFRCRNCDNCDFYMHVKTGPIIESSKNVRIGCSTLYYPELLSQMKDAGLDPFTNIWNDVHDFTPGSGNFTYESGKKLEMDIMNKDDNVLPFTFKADSEDSIFALEISEDKLHDLIQLSLQHSVRLISISKDGRSLKCDFESSSKEELLEAVSSLNPSL